MTKIILRRCLWFSIPVVITLLISGSRPNHEGGFWSEYQALLWIFAGATLLIGFGDGWFIWKMRERDYERKTKMNAPDRQTSVAASRGDPEFNAVSGRNSWN
jgi:uncharacterized membrane protein YbhN (UPF0104 family)